jgi:chemotaxis protein methyltransferase CheR
MSSWASEHALPEAPIAAARAEQGAAMTSSDSDSPAIFSILSSLVEERTGLHYGANERELFFERVQGRALEAGFDSLLDYYYFLRYDPAAAVEMRALAEALVVNETFFFREIEPLRVIVARLLAPAVREGRRPRVWSAACSSGEEPLTLAMLLADAGLLGDVEIVASDISDRVLARAKAGRYSPRAVRDGFDEHLASSFLTKQSSGEWLVARALIDAVQWRRVNLTERDAVAALGRFDVILCRNVLIYFSDETTTRVLRSLGDALQPSGALFVGVSESLLRFGTFLTCEERDRVFLYRHAS